MLSFLFRINRRFCLNFWCKPQTFKVLVYNLSFRLLWFWSTIWLILFSWFCLFFRLDLFLLLLRLFFNFAAIGRLADDWLASWPWFHFFRSSLFLAVCDWFQGCIWFLFLVCWLEVELCLDTWASWSNWLFCEFLLVGISNVASYLLSYWSRSFTFSIQTWSLLVSELLVSDLSLG